MAKREVLIPLEREDISFHGHTITAIKLEDGRIAIVLDEVCQTLELGTAGQIQRIERTHSITNELVIAKVQTKGGMQNKAALTLRGFPTWILGIHPSEIKNENSEKAEHVRQMIIAYQVEAVDVLYNHFAQKERASLPESAAIVLAEPVKPTVPQPDAPSNIWIEYHQQMIQWLQWKQAMETRVQKVEQRQENTEARVGSLEKIVGSILPHIGGLSTEHRKTAQDMVRQISKISGIHWKATWINLNNTFHVASYTDIPDEKWPEVQKWLQQRLDTARQGKGIEQQPSLFDGESQDK